ncbi:MAG TPA: hypothetical protein VFE34_06070 [Dongiaceae bacterium]|jgi:sugar lactone lactonase YvrE|nr:hypothetical protein [Dongiaceae bacterium]
MRHILLSLALIALPCAAHAQQADLPDAKLFPEGIAAAPDGTLYVGSFNRGEILRRPAGAASFEQFIEPGESGLVSVIGVAVDARRNLLFACSSDFGFGERAGRHPKDQPSALTAFDLKSGAPRGRWPLSPHSFCNDIAIQDDGSVLATDSLTPTIYRLAPDLTNFGSWLQDERWRVTPIGLNGIAVRGTDVYTVTYSDGRLFRIDAKQRVHEVELPRRLSLPDGVKVLSNGDLLLVEGSGRLTRIALSGDSARLTVLRDGLNQPTTVAPMEHGAWVLEGQIGLLADPAKHGQRPALPFRAVWVELLP